MLQPASLARKILISSQILDLSKNIILRQFSITSKQILVAQNFRCQQRKPGIWHTEQSETDKGNNKERKENSTFYLMFAIFNYSHKQI